MATPETRPTSFSKNEPVYATAFALWLVSVAGTFVLGHTKLVSSAQWSSLSTLLVPLISGLVLAAAGFVTRKFVAPAWKIVLREGQALGLSADQEAKIVDLVDSRISDTINTRLAAAAPLTPVEVDTKPAEAPVAAGVSQP